MPLSESRAVAASSPTESKTYACPCWMYAALVVSIVGAGGSLALTWVQGLTACPLCFYQRVFILACVGILIIGLMVRDLNPGRASLFAFPLAMGGFAVAVFHVNLEVTQRLECPAGLFGLGTVPQQSVVVFGLLLALLSGDLVQAGKAGHGIPAVGLAAGALGLVFAVALIFSGPPLPAYSEEPAFQKQFGYPNPPTVCRPPRPAA